MDFRRERALDVMLLSETWHDGDSVCIRRLRAEGLQVLERARPRTRSASLRVNHGGVAIAAAVPGVRMSAVTLNGGQHVYSSEHPCARLVVRGSACTVLLVYRPGSVAVDSMFYDEFSSLLDELVTRSEPLSDRGRRLQHQTRST